MFLCYFTETNVRLNSLQILTWNSFHYHQGHTETRVYKKNIILSLLFVQVCSQLITYWFLEDKHKKHHQANKSNYHNLSKCVAMSFYEDRLNILICYIKSYSFKHNFPLWNFYFSLSFYPHSHPAPCFSLSLSQKWYFNSNKKASSE